MTFVRLCLSALLTLLVPSVALAQSAEQPIVYVVRHLNTPAGERDPETCAAQALVGRRCFTELGELAVK